MQSLNLQSLYILDKSKYSPLIYHFCNCQEDTVDLARNLRGRKFVKMMGGLHIEMALPKVLGYWLDCSEWVSVVTTANITTDGRGDALKMRSFTAFS
jgi:hypothetical protein